MVSHAAIPKRVCASSDTHTSVLAQTYSVRCSRALTPTIASTSRAKQGIETNGRPEDDVQPPAVRYYLQHSCPERRPDRQLLQERTAGMDVTLVVFTVVGTSVAVLCALAGLVWWAYKRGQAAGAEKAGRDAARAEDQAKIDALERQLAETRAELAAIQPRRRRA
jgi:hypothetical protein